MHSRMHMGGWRRQDVLEHTAQFFLFELTIFETPSMKKGNPWSILGRQVVVLRHDIFTPFTLA